MPTSERARIARARRVVVKIGSSSLTEPGGGVLSEERLAELVRVLADRRLAGSHVVLVSSGAIAAGIAPLGLPSRPRDLATQQAAASVGQGALVAAYQRCFAERGLTVGQVLMTIDDVTRRSHYTNARRTLDRLLELGIVPIVNENDTVATHEIRFGDNDRLAALVAHLIKADAMVLLTDVDALYDGPPKRPGAQRIPLVRDRSDLDGIDIGGTGSAIGSGGMMTKVEAAGIANAAGIPVVLASAADVEPALAGEDVGTLFAATKRAARSRKLWIAHATTARGRITIDDGAVEAITKRRKSLLPAGITAVAGAFTDGDPVDVCALDGRVVARGLINYSSAELPEMIGRNTRELAKELGQEYEREAIHRDHLALL
ncbi:glutamate 5-kinase [Actinomycetota bacterium]